MKVKMALDRKSFIVSFRSRKEAKEQASFLDVVMQIEKEERDFIKRLNKRRAAGIG